MQHESKVRTAVHHAEEHHHAAEHHIGVPVAPGTKEPANIVQTPKAEPETSSTAPIADVPSTGFMSTATAAKDTVYEAGVDAKHKIEDFAHYAEEKAVFAKDLIVDSSVYVAHQAFVAKEKILDAGVFASHHLSSFAHAAEEVMAGAKSDVATVESIQQPQAVEGQIAAKAVTAREAAEVGAELLSGDEEPQAAKSVKELETKTVGKKLADFGEAVKKEGQVVKEAAVDLSDKAGKKLADFGGAVKEKSQAVKEAVVQKTDSAGKKLAEFGGEIHNRMQKIEASDAAAKGPPALAHDGKDQASAAESKHSHLTRQMAEPKIIDKVGRAQRETLASAKLGHKITQESEQEDEQSFAPHHKFHDLAHDKQKAEPAPIAAPRVAKKTGGAN